MRYLLVIVYLFSINCISQKNVVEEIDSKHFTFKDININGLIIKELNSEQLNLFKNYLKSNFMEDLDSLGYVTIVYLQPKNDCWYDNVSNINSKKWFDAKNFEPYMNTRLFFSHFDKRKSKYSVWDREQILYNIFPKEPTTCDYMLTINKKGIYIYKAGHFNIRYANAFYNELKVYE